MNQSTKINLIGCDTIVNSPSSPFFLYTPTTEKSVKVSIMDMLLPGLLLLSSGRRDGDEGDGLEFSEENICRVLWSSFSVRRYIVSVTI